MDDRRTIEQMLAVDRGTVIEMAMHDPSDAANLVQQLQAALAARSFTVSRESPTLDEQYGPGAEQADAEAQNCAAIIDELVAEREYQDKKWGHAFDDKNTLNDWSAYINVYLSRALGMENVGKPAEQRKAMVKVATLALAALETFDRNGGFAARHYDK